MGPYSTAFYLMQNDSMDDDDDNNKNIIDQFTFNQWVLIIIIALSCCFIPICIGIIICVYIWNRKNSMKQHTKELEIKPKDGHRKIPKVSDSDNRNSHPPKLADHDSLKISMDIAENEKEGKVNKIIGAVQGMNVQSNDDDVMRIINGTNVYHQNMNKNKLSLHCTESELSDGMYEVHHIQPGMKTVKSLKNVNEQYAVPCTITPSGPSPIF